MFQHLILIISSFFISFFILLLILLLYYHRKLFFHSKKLANIPSIPVTESFKLMFSKIPQNDVQTQYSKYATMGIYRSWYLNDWLVTISKYEYAKGYFSESVEDLQKWTYPDKHPIRKFVGDGLFFSSGHKWATHRRIATSVFNRTLSPEVVGKVVVDLTSLLDKFVDQPIDVFRIMQRTTIQVLGEIAFSYNFKCLENLEDQNEMLETYHQLLRFISDPFVYLFPWLNHLPTKSNIKFDENLKKFDGKMFEIIQNKKDEIQKAKLSNENPTPKNDLLYGMIVTAEKEGYDMFSSYLRDEMVTFFVAGHDSTSQSLSASLYHLAKYPKVQKKAREEAIRVLGAKGKIPTPEDLKNLKYINAVIKESLRLYPSSVITIPRITKKELNYGQMTIPKNTVTCINIWAIHHDPENWPDPEKFNPERFLSNKDDNNLHAWMPFSSGPRSCIGQNFSLMEQRVIISMLLLNYEISLPIKSPHKDKIILNVGELLSPQNLELVFSKRN